jgi:hypothetical protein
VKGLCNQQLAGLWSIGISRVDEVDAELNGTSQNFAGVITIRRPTPNALAGDAHRAKAKPVDGKIAP